MKMVTKTFLAFLLLQGGGLLTAQEINAQSANSIKGNSLAACREENKELEQKIVFNSLFQLGKVDVDGVKQKPDGKILRTRNLKTVKSIRIGFDTGDNKFLDSSEVVFYYRLISPTGETLIDAEMGSGTLQLATGAKIDYSKTLGIKWKNTNNRLEVYWKKDFAIAGIYKVQIYQTGYLIGSGQVKLL
jgi:hypothetical protein